MMGVDVADAAGVRGAVDGAVVLGEVEMEQAEGEHERERQDQGPSHDPTIIPRKSRTVKHREGPDLREPGRLSSPAQFC